MSLRWNPCVSLLGDECEAFLREYLDRTGRYCLLVGGAGFDPRTTVIAARFGKFVRAKVRGVFFREERPSPQPKLRARADVHQAIISKALSAEFLPVHIFADGVTPIGGREAVKHINDLKLEGVTDIAIDISALSTSVAFPVTRMLLEKCVALQKEGRLINLHLLTVEEPKFDHTIRGIPAESVGPVHGFRGDDSLDTGAAKALLWLPTLAPGAKTCLQKIYNSLSRHPTPIDVCPILPFPGHDPRMPDQLIAEYRTDLLRWRSDFRNLLYAAESDPLDAYRTICSVHATRKAIFDPLGGSAVVLSPVGNKLLAVGAMMAAIENNLQVAMVESVGYDEVAAELQIEEPCNSKINHIWLFGEAYAAR